MRLFKSLNLFKEIYKSGVIYPVPPTISYLWNFGSLALLCLGVQVVTGVFLAMHYAAHVDLAFNSVEHIMREVNNGWLLRYTHFNGASMFFLVVYIHMFRGLYYGSFMYPRILVWSVGVAILFLMMGTAFMGYVLPWGQMSFWAATVITNLASAFPLVGKPIVYWLWGGFSVDNATLNRFFSFHYIMPFILIGLVGLHVLMLHDPKSGNPMGIQTRGVDVIPLMPYFGVKDLLGYLIFILLFIYFVFFDPNVLGHPDNYIKANPLVTPAHIVPEWYFLPFYAILRVVPSKIGGVLLMLSAILILLVIPFIVKPTRRGFRPLHTIFFWIFVSNCFILGWIGGNPAEEPFTFIGSFATGVYFLYFLIIMPFVDYIETRLLSYYNK